MDVKVGDVVHVRGVVVAPLFYRDGILVDFEQGCDARIVRPECIVHVEPRQLHVGDRVKNRFRIANGVVVAIWQDRLWVLEGTQTHPLTFNAEDWERI